MEHTFEVGRALGELALILIAARLAGELSERIRIPAVIGEIVVGIVLGPSVLRVLDPGTHSTTFVVLELLGMLGAVLLLAEVGLELDLAGLARVGPVAVAVAVIGVVAPMVGGASIAYAWGTPFGVALFVGGALAATSVGITARVFADLRMLATIDARIVLGAAVTDDVLGLLVLTAITPLATGDSMSAISLAGTLGGAVAFLLVGAAIGFAFVPMLVGWVHRTMPGAASTVSIALGVLFLYSAGAEAVGLAPIIGAVLAGAALAKSSIHEEITTRLGGLSAFLVPVFFVSIGVQVDVRAFTSPSVLALAGALTAVGLLGKVVAGAPARNAGADPLAVGLGMIPRGEVGLIFIAVGQAAGVLDSDIAGALILAVLATTLIGPPLLRARMLKTHASDAAKRPPTDHGQPLRRRVPEICALAMQSADGVTLSSDWFEEIDSTTLHATEWDLADTPLLIRVARRRSPRAWRVLEVSGVMDDSLPEVAAFLSRSRAASFDPDPGAHLRFPTVERLLGSNSMRTHGPVTDRAVLTALIGDVASGSDRTSLTERLVGSAEAAEVVAISGHASALVNASRSHFGIDERTVRQFADVLADPAERADAFAVASAQVSADPDDSGDETLAQLCDLVVERSGSGLSGRVADRIRDAVAATDPGEFVRARLDHLPTEVVTHHDAPEWAALLRTVDPLPPRGRVRVAVLVEHPAGSFDGLTEPTHTTKRVAIVTTAKQVPLAKITAVLSDHGIEVSDATIAAWPDGGVLVTVDTASVLPFDTTAMEVDLQRALATPRRPTPQPVDATSVHFTYRGSERHPIATVTAPDRPGLLAAITAHLEAAHVRIHAATVTTVSGTAVDRFELSDRRGGDLSDRDRTRLQQRLLATDILTDD